MTDEKINTPTTLVGNFRELTEQDEQDIDEWIRKPETARLFREGIEKVRREAREFRKRTTVTHEMLTRPFTG
jgi:hypothetical protein